MGVEGLLMVGRVRNRLLLAGMVWLAIVWLGLISLPAQAAILFEANLPALRPVYASADLLYALPKLPAEEWSAEELSAKEPSAELIVALKNRMAAELGLPDPSQIAVHAETVDWSDGCLELAGADEICAQVITLGYRILLRAQGQTRTYHTNRTGSLVRLAPGE